MRVYYPFVPAMQQHGIARVVWMMRPVREQHRVEIRFGVIVERLAPCRTRTLRDVYLFMNREESFQVYQAICRQIDRRGASGWVTGLRQLGARLARFLNLIAQRARYRKASKEPVASPPEPPGPTL